MRIVFLRGHKFALTRGQRGRAGATHVFTFAVFTEAVSLMPTDRLARGLKANLALEMLRSPTQVRKVTAVRREFVVRPLKWDTDLPLSRHFCAARHRCSRKWSHAVSESD